PPRFKRGDICDDYHARFAKIPKLQVLEYFISSYPDTLIFNLHRGSLSISFCPVNLDSANAGQNQTSSKIVARAHRHH
ncbi:MAG: hypothetical protein ACREFE_18455, partial [Limisphaerales bacterium]